MSETKTGSLDDTSQAYRVMEGKLGTDGLSMLNAQLDIWQRLNERTLASPLRNALKTRQTELPKGTLLHGMGMHAIFDPEAIEGVATKGIVSGELIGKTEDSETHGCADFFKTPDDMTIADYMAFATEKVHEGNLYKQRGERLLSRGIAFIVDPRAEGMNELLAHDGYTDSDMHGFVHPPSGRTAEDTAAILGGVPRGAIAGILASETLLANPDVTAKLSETFPDVPVLDHTGQLHA